MAVELERWTPMASSCYELRVIEKHISTSCGNIKCFLKEYGSRGVQKFKNFVEVVFGTASQEPFVL